jgi:folate-binding protein YgfZ
VINGVPAFGIDFGPDDNPHQASLERRTVSWTKGCYLGQEVVCMQDMRGKTKRRLVRLYSRDASLWQEGMRVLDAEGAELGQITTANPSANEEIACAIARVKAPNFEPGSKVYVAEQSATVGSLMSAPRGL